MFDKIPCKGLNIVLLWGEETENLLPVSILSPPFLLHWGTGCLHLADGCHIVPSLPNKSFLLRPLGPRRWLKASCMGHRSAATNLGGSAPKCPVGDRGQCSVSTEAPARADPVHAHLHNCLPVCPAQNTKIAPISSLLQPEIDHFGRVESSP